MSKELVKAEQNVVTKRQRGGAIEVFGLTPAQLKENLKVELEKKRAISAAAKEYLGEGDFYFPSDLFGKERKAGELPVLGIGGMNKLLSLFGLSVPADMQKTVEIDGGYRVEISIVTKNGDIIAGGVGSCTVYEKGKMWVSCSDDEYEEETPENRRVQKFFKRGGGSYEKKQRKQQPQEIAHNLQSIATKRAIGKALPRILPVSGIFSVEDAIRKPEELDPDRRELNGDELKSLFDFGKSAGLSMEKVKQIVFEVTGRDTMKGLTESHALIVEDIIREKLNETPKKAESKNAPINTAPEEEPDTDITPEKMAKPADIKRLVDRAAKVNIDTTGWLAQANNMTEAQYLDLLTMVKDEENKD